MDALRTYLRALPSEEARIEFAVKCGTTLGHLRNVMGGRRDLSPEICVAVEQASNRQVTRQQMRPDDYWRIWPELVTSRARRQPAKQA